MSDDSCEHPGLVTRLHDVTNNYVSINWTYVRDENWMPVHHFLVEYNSTIEPEYLNVDLHPSERLYTIDNCSAGTKYSITVTSIDINGRAIVRAKPLIVETSAPIERPVLKLLHNEPGAITISWNRPREFGNARIREYFLQVNGQHYAKIISTQTELTYTECRALRTYTFRLQAISKIPDCDSDYSHILDATCPGALPITLERTHSKSIDNVKVAWSKPVCQGGARVREYRIYYRKVENDKNQPSKDKIIDHAESILHTLSPSSVEDSLQVEPDKYYWAILEAEIVPDGCPNLVTPSIKLHATKKPISPEVSIDLYGLKERLTFDKEMAYLVDKRDRLKNNINAINNSVLVKGERVSDEEVQRRRVLLHRMEKRLKSLLEKINEHTGTVSAVVKWKTPNFDEFSEPMGYRVLVNDEIVAENLPLDTKEFCVKLGVNDPIYEISVSTLSRHCIGHGRPSEKIQISSSEFRKVRFFCYFNGHKKQASWPDGGCCLEATLEYERDNSTKPFPQRAFITERIHALSFHAMGVFDGVWEPLGKHFGKPKPTGLLFWTKWCESSKRAMEYYCSFAKAYGHEFRLLTCCVFSEEPMVNHQYNIMNIMTHNNWKENEGVQHFCACHPGPHSKLRKRDVENSSFSKSYKLLGVPTLVLIDSEGYIAWQGRVFGDNAETFFNYLRHTFSVIDKSECPIKLCEHCDSERYGVLYTEKDKPVFTGNDLTMKKFNDIMEKQREKLGDDSAMTYTRQTIYRNPAISIACCDNNADQEGDERNVSAINHSIRSFESRSTTFESQNLRCSSHVSTGSSLVSTWSHSQFRYGDRGDSEIKHSKSVGFQDVLPKPTKAGTRQSSRVTSRTLSEKRAVSALPNIGRRRQKVTVPVRPKTATILSTGKKQSSGLPVYDWVTSRYSQSDYKPYNPYRGASYAKNGSAMSFYSKCGHLPTKPFPNDKGFAQVSWSSNQEIKKQKVPSHREMKYMRNSDWP